MKEILKLLASNVDKFSKELEMKKYEKDSLLQRTADPFTFAVRLENGTHYYELKDLEFGAQLDEQSLRASRY